MFPLPRFCWPVRKCRGGHSLGRARRECARVTQANRILGRLEQLDKGRLWEEVDAAPAPAPSHCGRSAREGAAAQVWEAVCSQDPPLDGCQGVDALSEIAEDVGNYAFNERCDVVRKEECFSEWMSLPGGAVGEFNAMEKLVGDRKEQYAHPTPILAPPELAAEAAAAAGAHVGMEAAEYHLLVARMLRIRMTRLRKKVKVVNGVFGVWKEKPERNAETAGASVGPHAGSSPLPVGHPTKSGQPLGEGIGTAGGPPPGKYKKPGKIRLIIDMRKGNCYFLTPDKVELLTPTALAQMTLEPDEIMLMSKADLDNYFYRCWVPEAYQEYFGLPPVRVGDLGLSPEEIREHAPGAGDDTILFPAMCVLPMGWSHSPLVAQEAHENLLEEKSELREASRLRDSKPWGGRRRVHFSYIDDTIVIVIGKRADLGKLRAECDKMMASALDAYEAGGLPVKAEKVEKAALVLTALGLEVDGDKGTVGVCSARRRRLERAIRHLLGGGVCNGRALAAVVGHLTWAFMCRRPLLSVLWQSYRFIRALGRRVGVLWPEVRAELATAADLLCLAQASLRREWATGRKGDPVVGASDASLEGGGVVATEVSGEEMEGLLAHVGVKGGHVPPLHAPGLSEVEMADPAVGTQGPLWERGGEGPACRGRGHLGRGMGPPERKARGAPAWDLIEIGEGTGRLARAMRAAGGRATAWEVRPEDSHRNFDWVRKLIRAVEGGGVGWVHFSPPHRTFMGRYLNARPRVRDRGEERAEWERACWDRVMGVICRVGSRCLWSVSHPSQSRAWDGNQTRRALSQMGVESALFPYCAWGAPVKRYTRIIGRLPWMLTLERRCSMGHAHLRPPGGLGGELSALPRRWCRFSVARYMEVAWGSPQGTETELGRGGLGGGAAGQPALGAQAPPPPSDPSGETPPAGPIGIRPLVGPRHWERWKIAVCVEWKHKAHINILEAFAETLAISWVLRKGTPARPRRTILLQDSQVVVYAGTKGRSSSLPLLRALRRSAALQLGGNLYIDRLWLPSHANPADGPSRGRAIGVF